MSLTNQEIAIVLLLAAFLSTLWCFIAYVNRDKQIKVGWSSSKEGEDWVKVELRILRKDHQYSWCSAIADSPLIKVVYMDSTVRDWTEAQLLRHCKRQFQTQYTRVINTYRLLNY